MRTRKYSLMGDGSVHEVTPEAAKNIRPLPGNAEYLVRELAEMVPERCIGAAESVEQAHRYAGKRELVSHLIARLELTNSTDPTKPLLR